MVGVSYLERGHGRYIIDQSEPDSNVFGFLVVVQFGSRHSGLR